MIKQISVFILFASFSIICTAQRNQIDADGKKHGAWKVNFEGTQHPKFEGTFQHGEEVGEFKFYKKGFYMHPAAIMHFPEVEDSVSVTYYTQAGKPISDGKMIDRKREGKWVYYHQENDSIMMTEIYENDLLNGEQKTYFPNGELAEKTIYLNDIKHGISLIFADNGQTTKKLNYKEGKLHGSATYFSVEGVKTIEGSYIDGRKTGKWIYYTDGEIEREEDY